MRYRMWVDLWLVLSSLPQRRMRRIGGGGIAGFIQATAVVVFGLLAASTAAQAAPPTASIVVADDSLTIGETTLVTITFSEQVTGFTNADLSVPNGWLSAVSSSDGGITWTATFTPGARITVSSNAIILDNTGVSNAGGESGVGTTDSNNYAIDTARPTATVVVANTHLGIGQTSEVTITFSEAVTGFTNADLTTANGTLSGLSSSDGGITWMATLTPTAGVTQSGNVITLNLNGVADVAGNTGAGTVQSNAYALDSQRPTATITLSQAIVHAGQTATVTFTFSEAVTGFSLADVATSNAALSNLSTSNNIVFTAMLTPVEGIIAPTNVIILNVLGVTDQAGNAGTGTTNSASYAIDTVSTLTISPPTLPSAVVGTVFSQTIAASGGTRPYSYRVTVGALPAEIKLDPVTGVLSGTPTRADSYNFTITATDASQLAKDANYTLAVNEAVPTAMPDNATAIAGQPASIRVTENDTGIISSIAIATAPARGTVSVSGTTIVYTPAPDFSGTDTLRYTATGPGGTSAPALVTIAVGEAAPAAMPDKATAIAGQPVSIRVIENDTGAISSVAIATAPAKGTASVDGTMIVYTPAPDFSGTDTLRYTATGPGGTSALALVTIEVAARPVAITRHVSVEAGKQVVIDLTDGATGGPFTTAALVSASPSSAGPSSISNLKLTFTPSVTFEGSMAIVFTLSNAFATSLPATIHFDVTGRPDPSRDTEVIGLLSAQVDSAKRFAGNQTRNFNSRLEQLHDEGDRRRNSMAIELGYATGRQEAADDRFADVLRNNPAGTSSSGVPDFAMQNYAADGKEHKPRSKPADVDLGSFAVWTGGYVNFGKQNGGNISLDYTTAGLSAGVDYRFSKSLVAGFGFGYGRDATDIGSNGTESRAHAYSAAIYASYSPVKSVFLDGLIGGSWLDFASRRHETPTGNFALGDRNGRQLFGSITASYEQRNEAWLVSPYGRLDFSRSWLDSFSERGVDAYTLKYGSQTVDTLSGVAGLRLEYAIPMDWGVLKPGARVEYTHDFEGSSRVKLGYADVEGLPYEQVTGGSGSDYVTLGASLDAALNYDWTANLDYRTAVGTGNRNHAFGLRVGKKF
ncbi:Ig-like domain-containing protein [Mesorhizobium sp. NPDC059054]|uniref:Ig-like domain-containing protein n=1 Tax=Mesorhizobium sp. NPDC059054 TaxID=3346711 RepID=UPI0036A754CE